MTHQLSPTGRFERLMLTTEGSERSAEAEHIATELACLSGAKLFVCTMVVNNPVAQAMAFEQVEQAEREANELLERVKTAVAERGVEVLRVLRSGVEPAIELAAAAEEQRVDLVVVGRHEKPGLLRRLLGTTAAQVIGRAPCSVLVVPAGAQMWQQRILLATDGSRFSDAAGVAAARLASRFKLPVTVLSTVRESFDTERAAQAHAAALRMTEDLKARDIEADPVVERGDPDKLIIEIAAARGADLIVMGTHGRTGWERLLVGSVTESVVGASPIPVLVAKL